MLADGHKALHKLKHILTYLLMHLNSNKYATDFREATISAEVSLGWETDICFLSKRSFLHWEFLFLDI